MGVGILGPEVGHAQFPFQRAAGGDYLDEDAADVFIAERSGIVPQQPFNDLLLAQGLVDVGAVGALEMADFQRQLGALAQQREQLIVDPVDSRPQAGQPIFGMLFLLSR